jgi:hypothetical protein
MQPKIRHKQADTRHPKAELPSFEFPNAIAARLHETRLRRYENPQRATRNPPYRLSPLRPKFPVSSFKFQVSNRQPATRNPPSPLSPFSRL